MIWVVDLVINLLGPQRFDRIDEMSEDLTLLEALNAQIKVDARFQRSPKGLDRPRLSPMLSNRIQVRLAYGEVLFSHNVPFLERRLLESL